MSQFQAYLVEGIIHTATEMASSVVNALLNFTENFPHTTARYQHLLYLISDDNLDHWNLQHMLLVALLPAYIMHFWNMLELRHSGLGVPRPTFHDIAVAMRYSFCASKCYSIFVILYIGWSVPPGGSKLMTWIDLCLESTLTAVVAATLWFIPFILANFALGWREVIITAQILFDDPED